MLTNDERFEDDRPCTDPFPRHPKQEQVDNLERLIGLVRVENEFGVKLADVVQLNPSGASTFMTAADKAVFALEEVIANARIARDNLRSGALRQTLADIISVARSAIHDLRAGGVE